MKVFTNGTDTVVAADLDDVPAAWEWSHGVSFIGESGDLAEWRQIADDQPITICNADDRGSKETRTAREWANKNGRGLLCSTEY